MQKLEKEGHVDVFYGDGSGFCLTSAIPYGWQFPGEQVATPPRHSPRFNVLGFYNATTNELHTATREGTLDAAFVTDTLDAWAATRTRPTVLVPDNAKIHHAAAFQARLEAWQVQDLHFLPAHLQPPPQQNRNPVAQNQIRMASARSLRHLSNPESRRLAHP